MLSINLSLLMSLLNCWRYGVAVDRDVCPGVRQHAEHSGDIKSMILRVSTYLGKPTQARNNNLNLNGAMTKKAIA